LLLYKTPELWAQDFEFIFFDLGQVFTFGPELAVRDVIGVLSTG
jgi:hypothetical protein